MSTAVKRDGRHPAEAPARYRSQVRPVRARGARLATAVRRTRRLAVALWRFARLPKWLAVVLIVAAAIPGFIDDLLVLLVVGFIIIWQLRTRANRVRFSRDMHEAWRV